MFTRAAFGPGVNERRFLSVKVNKIFHHCIKMKC